MNQGAQISVSTINSIIWANEAKFESALVIVEAQS